MPYPIAAVTCVVMDQLSQSRLEQRLKAMEMPVLHKLMHHSHENRFLMVELGFFECSSNQKFD